MVRNSRIVKLVLVAAAAALAGSILIAQPPPSPQEADKSRNGVVSSGAKAQAKDDANLRTVEGIVTDAAKNPVPGASVQLKDTRTLQIRSFVTQADGTYRFAGLRTDVDYELKAVLSDQTSSIKRVSSFESRKVVSVNLAFEKK